MITAALRFVSFWNWIRFYLTRPSWLSEVASGVATTGWGLTAAQTDQYRADAWPSVELFFQVHPSPAWGEIAAVLGLGQLFLFQLIDNTWERPWLRWGTAILVAWIWGSITMSALQADPLPPGTWAYFGWWFVNVYLISRIFWTRSG